jgi:hypothetical protein
MSNIFRKTIYCFKCDSAKVMVYFKGDLIPDFYGCSICRETFAIPKNVIDEFKKFNKEKY